LLILQYVSFGALPGRKLKDLVEEGLRLVLETPRSTHPPQPRRADEGRSRRSAFASIAAVGLDLPEGSHGELSLYQFKSQLPSDELGGTLQDLDRYVALCVENPIDLSAACVH
jgi:hypothetical protein